MCGGIEPDIDEGGAGALRGVSQRKGGAGDDSVKKGGFSGDSEHSINGGMNAAIPACFVGISLAAGIDFEVSLETPVHFQGDGDATGSHFF